MRDGLLITAVSLAPRRQLTRFIGWTSRQGWSRRLLDAYISFYGVDVSELDRPLDDYDNLLDFFVRKLPDGARPIADTALVSPVDGAVSTFGTIAEGRFVQFGDQLGSVAQLLDADATPWEGDQFAVLYLSPKNYHRVHTPISGTVRRLDHRPGKLWPVLAAAVRRIPGLFEGNERLVIELDTDRGPVAVVMVAALGVADISHELTVGTTVQAGEELGVFGLGSTVILIAPDVTWALTEGQPIRLGEALTS